MWVGAYLGMGNLHLVHSFFRLFGGVAVDSYWMAFFTSLLTFSIRLYQRKNEAKVCVCVCVRVRACVLVLCVGVCIAELGDGNGIVCHGMDAMVAFIAIHVSTPTCRLIFLANKCYP